MPTAERSNGCSRSPQEDGAVARGVMRVRIDGMIADKVGADRGRERSRGCDGDGGREERVERDVVLIYRALR